MRRRSVLLLAVWALAGAGLLLAALIVVGEVRDDYTLSGTALGAILLAYALIVLFLRKLGFIGPRRAEGK